MKITRRSLIFIVFLVCCPVVILGSLAFLAQERSPNIRVQFIDSRVGWIVGPRLLRTTDGGRTWNVVRSDGYGTLNVESIGFGHRVVQFINTNSGVQLGLNAIARTTDGGQTWSDQFSIPKPDKGDIPPQSLFFLTTEVGWLVGEVVYHTSDGGRSWEQLGKTPRGDVNRQRKMRIAPSIADFTPALWFTGIEKGLMARLDGEVYLTGDGGRTWNMIWRVDKRITDLFFINNQNGWIVGEEGFIARTSDGGRTWSSIPSSTRADLTNIFFLNERIGWASGFNSTILYTKDGGETWKQGSINPLSGSPPLASVSFADELHGFAVGGNADSMYPSLVAPSNIVLTSDDGGQTWVETRP